tara:strand:- start:4782 stop:5291 length:510 start_codon:yes stop_codon:yes gene_type:complete
MNSKRDLVKVTEEINKLALAAFQSLGSGFKEETFQKALSISFRKEGIMYLKETNLEIFYLKESLGVFRLDFLLPKQKNKKFTLKKPIVIETKAVSEIRDSDRLQLRNYLFSLPLNQSEVLSEVTEGIILNWRNNIYIDKEDAIQTEVEAELWRMKKNKMHLIHQIPDSQ